MATDDFLGFAATVGIMCALLAAPEPGTAVESGAQRVRAPITAAMVWIPGGKFDMGSADPMFADAQPVHPVLVHGFWMDATDVTNADFAKFVEATGYATVAERPLPAAVGGSVTRAVAPGSTVFYPPKGPVSLDTPLRWWRYVPGANWKHPEGPGSTIRNRMDHPVVQVAFDDALAYAKWVGKRLPTEAEFEFAARGGLDRKAAVWGGGMASHEHYEANTFQGDFPYRNFASDGYQLTSPVHAFPPNAFGLYDMAGNVWQWVADWYSPDYYRQLAAQGDVARDPKGPSTSYDPMEPNVPKRVQRGGSFLCTDTYCAGFRPGARGKGAPDTGSNHLGFRLVSELRD